MIDSKIREYVLMHIFIAVYRYTPLIYLTLLLGLTLRYGWHDAHTTLLFRALGTSLVLEIIFAITLYRSYVARLRNAARHPPPLSRSERKELFERCMTQTAVTEEYLRLWFLGADPADVRRENIKEFLSWGFFDRPLGDTVGKEGDEDADDLEELLSRVEILLGKKFEDGRGAATCLRTTLDQVESRYRSLLWYTTVSFVDLATHVFLAYRGFHYYAQCLGKGLKVFPPRAGHLVSRSRTVAADLSYWYRPHTAKDKLPIVFLHGIGIGLWTYTNFLSELADISNGDEQVGILAIEILPISFRLPYEDPLERREFTRQMTKILDFHGFAEFVIVAHSYGSVLTAHMLRCPALELRISSLVLVDPVSLLLHEPHVAYNFTRRRPRTAAEWKLWYFASMDPAVAYVLCRHLFWRESILWKEDLVRRGEAGRGKRQVTVFLAEEDIIVNTAGVVKYLTEEQKGSRDDCLAGCSEEERGGKSCSIDVVLLPGLDHAQVWDCERERKKLIDVVKTYCGNEVRSAPSPSEDSSLCDLGTLIS